MKKKLFLLGLLFIGFSAGSFAQATPVSNKKQRNQTKRIIHGVKTGELTKSETKKLVEQQVHINRTKRRAKADGKVTRRERREIKRKQHRASANIYHKKHNIR
jgi:lipopolysaccharide export LptBFGC system permease protein LptF